MKKYNRVLINYKKDNKIDCTICNPILPCYKSSICEECFIWLAQIESHVSS
jgi:hypothetical protein